MQLLFLNFHACFGCKFASSLLSFDLLLYLFCPVFSVLLWDGFLMRLSGMNLKTKLMLREKLNQCQYLSIFYKMNAPVVLSILFQSYRDVKVNLIWYMTVQHFCFPFISLISSSIQRYVSLLSLISYNFFFEIINLSLCHFFFFGCRQIRFILSGAVLTTMQLQGKSVNSYFKRFLRMRQTDLKSGHSQ